MSRSPTHLIHLLFKQLPVLLVPCFATVAVGRERPDTVSHQEVHAAISGTVVDVATGRPLPDAYVSVTTSGGTQRFAVIVSTDSLGRFALSPVPAPASYIVRAARKGYEDGGLTRRNPLDQSGSDISLLPGQWTRITIRLIPLGSIRGRVVDEAGEPVIGVPVRVVERIVVAGQPHLAAGPIGETDDRGEYKVERLRAGSYFVTLPSVQSTVPTADALIQVAAPRDQPLAESPVNRMTAGGVNSFVTGGCRLVIGNYAVPPASAVGLRLTYPVLFHPNATAPGSARQIDLSVGEDRLGVDFVLEPLRAVNLSGFVHGPADARAGLVLRLVPAGSEELGMGSEQATSLVNRDGSFCLAGVPAGRYTLIARRSVAEFVKGAPIAMGLPQTPGWARGISTATTIASAPSGTRLAFRSSGTPDTHQGQLEITVGSDDVTGIILPLRPTATLSGRFVYEGQLSGRGGVIAIADPALGEAYLATPQARPSVADAGRFAIPFLREGQYFLRLRSGTDWCIKSIEVGGRDYTNRPIDMTNGDVSEAVVTVTDQSTTLVGTVRDDRGRPVHEAAVIAFPVDRGHWTHFGFDPPYIRAVSDISGHGYRLRGLPQAAYYLIAVDIVEMDSWQNPSFFRLAALLAERVTVQWGQVVQRDLVIRKVRR